MSRLVLVLIATLALWPASACVHGWRIGHIIISVLQWKRCRKAKSQA